MSIRRISGPAPIITPADVPGSHDPADASIAALIAAVQAAIDGPTGWLKLSLGAQRLELATDRFSRSILLPCGPVTDIVSVAYRDRAGESQAVNEADYRLADGNRCLFGTGFRFPDIDCVPDALTITYEAGFEGSLVPPNAKQAVVIGVQHLKAMSGQSLFLREERVEGVGSTVFTVSEAANAAVRAATDMLLSPLRMLRL